MKKIFLISSLLVANMAYSQDLILDRSPTESRVISSVSNSNKLDENQKTLLLQMAQLKQQKLNYEKSQADFYNALNDRTQTIVQREKDLNILGAELLAGLDKIENSKKELQQSITQYNIKYKQLATVEASLVKREATLRDLENNLANQDLVLMTKADQLATLQNNLNSRDSQLKAQAQEIAQLKQQLAQLSQNANKPYAYVKHSQYKRVRKYSHKGVVKNVTKVAPKVETTKPHEQTSPGNPTDFLKQTNVYYPKINPLLQAPSLEQAFLASNVQKSLIANK